jgi:hypothetical protein
MCSSVTTITPPAATSFSSTSLASSTTASISSSTLAIPAATNQSTLPSAVAETSLAATPLPPSANAALIGGIVGGVVALLLIGGLIACFVARSQRQRKGEPTKGAMLQSVRPTNNGVNMPNSPESNYGIIGPNITEYEHGDVTIEE